MKRLKKFLRKLFRRRKKEQQDILYVQRLNDNRIIIHFYDYERGIASSQTLDIESR